MSIRILLADDHRLMREGLRVLIEKETDMEVIAEAEDGRAALRLARELSPDVVVMDVTMPELNGIDATRQLVVEAPGVKVVALSMYSDRRFVSGMLKAGASSYLVKDCAIEELVDAIRAMMAGKIYLSQEIAGLVTKEYLQQLSMIDSPDASTLTCREREVLQLMAEGKTTKEIASCLSVSARTIDTHRQNIMDKLGIHSVAELTKYAIREGLTPLES